MTFNEFFEKGKALSQRFEASKEAIKRESGQKELALAIEDKLSQAVLSIDTDKLVAAIDVEALPSFGFDKEQKEEMVKDICATIRSEHYTLSEFINVKDGRLTAIMETIVGGVAEPYDELIEEYKYEKKLEEERKNLLLITQHIETMAQMDRMSQDVQEIVDVSGEIRSTFKLSSPPKTFQAKLGSLKAALTGYMILESKRIPVNPELSSKNFAELRVGLEEAAQGEKNMVDMLRDSVRDTFEEVRKSFPDLSPKLDSIRESFFNMEQAKEADTASAKEPPKEVDETIYIDFD